MKFETFYTDGVVLTPDFWDCQCLSNYIHRKSETRVCNQCGCEEGESPDSRADEILVHFPDILSEEERNQIIQMIAKDAFKRGTIVASTILNLNPS